MLQPFTVKDVIKNDVQVSNIAPQRGSHYKAAHFIEYIYICNSAWLILRIYSHLMSHLMCHYGSVGPLEQSVVIMTAY